MIKTSAFIPGEKRRRREKICRLSLILSDIAAVFGGLVIAYILRFQVLALLPAQSGLNPSSEITLQLYVVRIISGGALALGLLLWCGAYQGETLLRFRRSFPVVLKAILLWIVIFPCLALVFELDDKLSRVYVITSFFCLLLTLLISRFLVQRFLSSRGYTAAFRQRILFVDWTEKTARLAASIAKDPWHPYDLIGCAPSPKNRFTENPPSSISALGSYEEVKTLCDKGVVDIVILADGRRSEEDLFSLVRLCEMTHVRFMVIPSGFQVLLSGLALSTVSAVPLLGVTKLPLDRPMNAAVKRSVDVVGALVGIILSAPVILVFCTLVYLESPGPVFYRQIRTGRRGRPITITKIRSMKIDAEAASGAKWATKNDDRRLKIGAFMRRTNIDELPQFWSVLRGQLSLVGPRPERPELIKKFREEIAFYNARHNIIPGMTGWAQINGFRGDTDLSERIRCDIYYIENWNIVLDVQIMLMTFFRWKGAH